MKNRYIQLALLFSVVALATMSGCKKEEDEEVDPCSNMTVNTFEANIDGQKWCANLTLSANYAVVMTITGINQSAWSISMDLDDVVEGTYTLAENTNTTFLTVGGMVYESTNEDPGTLTIIEHNTTGQRIRGTFSGNFYSPLGGSKSVTDGSFDVGYSN